MIWAVTPVNDTEKHEDFSSMCKCQPEVKVREDGDLVYVHNSFDGRELIEQINEILK